MDGVKTKWISIGIVLLLFLFPAFSTAQDSGLSVAYIVGVYQPSLKTFNKILGDPSLSILQDPNYLLPRNRLLPVEVRDIIAPKITGNTNYGLEVQYEATERFSLVGTLSIWNGQSKASDILTTFLRQDLPPVLVPRTATYDLTISQIWFGWKYTFYEDPDKGRFFVNIGLVGISIANLMMDSVIKVNSPELNFASVSSTEAQGIAFTSRLGIGGEYFITPWFSFGVNTNYVIGSSSRIKVKRHFQSSFFNIPAPPPETTDLANIPPRPESGDTLTSARVRTQNITDVCDPPARDDQGGVLPNTCARGPQPAGNPLELELNGFQVTASFRFYF
jgi:hypothetical protein